MRVNKTKKFKLDFLKFVLSSDNNFSILSFSFEFYEAEIIKGLYNGSISANLSFFGWRRKLDGFVLEISDEVSSKKNGHFHTITGEIDVYNKFYQMKLAQKEAQLLEKATKKAQVIPKKKVKKL